MPGPVDIEMAFGDPEAVDKAAARMQDHDYCQFALCYCPWKKICDNDPDWQCPAGPMVFEKGGD